MSFTIEKLPGSPVVILTQENGRALAEMELVLNGLDAVLDAQPEPVFLVLDIRGLAIELDDLTSATRAPGALLHHPNVRENLMISRDGMIKLGVQGLRRATFGSVSVRIFDTTEQALDYCREQIAIANNPYVET